MLPPVSVNTYWLEKFFPLRNVRVLVILFCTALHLPTHREGILLRYQ